MYREAEPLLTTQHDKNGKRRQPRSLRLDLGRRFTEALLPHFIVMGSPPDSSFQWLSLERSDASASIAER
jgi:hypothetical protein